MKTIRPSFLFIFNPLFLIGELIVICLVLDTIGLSSILISIGLLLFSVSYGIINFTQLSRIQSLCILLSSILIFTGINMSISLFISAFCLLIHWMIFTISSRIEIHEAQLKVLSMGRTQAIERSAIDSISLKASKLPFKDIMIKSAKGDIISLSGFSVNHKTIEQLETI